MNNKKAWLRIAEAFIAILIVASVLIAIVLKVPRESKTENIHEIQRHILTQISLNETLRGEILLDSDTTNNAENKLNESINSIKPVYLDFEIRICGVDEVCGILNYAGKENKEIYADEILISANLNNFAPKKLKFFVWRK